MTMTEFGIVLGISLLKISVVAFVLRLIRKVCIPTNMSSIVTDYYRHHIYDTSAGYVMLI